ncbi:TPA: hypothetical protein N0F65_005025 [Lagenidium giganteum]|uniref:DUF659 domain-containing protein n=1 Tax=Lagenidium giganteum TaxID=4803 RepID=A0AAV2ZI05_9STRA|nr:TPA: hypothetical protein N0F65_005025 [Lagenidium giganteum]
MLLRDREHLTLTRRSLPDRLLEATYHRERHDVISTLRAQSYLSLVSDGWTNTNNDGTVNFVICSQMLRPMLWSSVAVGEEAHTSECFARHMDEVITEIESCVGNDRICAVVTNNASNMKKVRSVLEGRYKRTGMFFSGCGAHTLNLLLKDVVMDVTCCTRVLEQAKTVVKLVKSAKACFFISRTPTATQNVREDVPCIVSPDRYPLVLQSQQRCRKSNGIA